MKVIDRICVENSYSGSNWNFEKTTKYVIDMDGVKLEAGYFEHYRGNTLIKTVIELPQSYGCPSGCRFCATSAIEAFRPLNAEVLSDIFEYIYGEHDLKRQSYVLLTMTGMGDIYFNYDNVEQFLLGLQYYDNLHVTLSSCLWNKQLLRKVQSLGNKLDIRNIQITFVSEKTDLLCQIIPYYRKVPYDFEDLRRVIEQSKEQYYRINYIMIKGINDSWDDFCSFCERVQGIKDKIVVRISKLNETCATKRNGLQPTDIHALESMQSLLQENGVRSYVFFAYKNDNMNCGQLITENMGSKGKE